MTLRGVIFDIDGTLADTLGMCVESFQVYLEQALGRPFSAEEVSSQFGKSEEGIIRKYFPEGDAALDDYFKVFETLHQKCSEPFPGVVAVLERLRARGVPTAVVTGKGIRGAEIALRVMGLSEFFPVVEGGAAEGPNKPLCMRQAARRLGICPVDLIYVGDTPYDIESAFSSGLYPVGAAWAPTTTLTGNELHAGKIFRNIADFSAWLETAIQ